MPVIILLCMIQGNADSLNLELPPHFYRSLYDTNAAMTPKEWREVSFELNMIELFKDGTDALPRGVSSQQLYDCVSNADTRKE